MKQFLLLQRVFLSTHLEEIETVVVACDELTLHLQCLVI